MPLDPDLLAGVLKAAGYPGAAEALRREIEDGQEAAAQELEKEAAAIRGGVANLTPWIETKAWITAKNTIPTQHPDTPDSNGEA